MAAITESPAPARRSGNIDRTTPMSFPAQVAMLTWRALLVNLRVPAVVIPPLLINTFFLLIYEAQLGGLSAAFLGDASYLGFIVPLSVASAALGGSAVAGQTIVGDIAGGYFDKLILTPVSRWALLLGPMLAGALLIAAQTVAILLLGLLLGLRPVTGAAGLLATIGFAVLLGAGFAGVTVGVALRTGNAAATGGAGLLFFPLSFLTSTFVPLDELSGWIEIAARINPITYVLEAMRAILNTGWEPTPILRGLGAGAALFALLFAFALYGLRSRTRRR